MGLEFNLWKLANNPIQLNSFGDWARIEGNRSLLEPWQLSLLKKWDATRDKNQIMDVLKNIIPEFRNIHKQLCKKLNINEEGMA